MQLPLLGRIAWKNLHHSIHHLDRHSVLHLHIAHDLLGFVARDGALEETVGGERGGERDGVRTLGGVVGKVIALCLFYFEVLLGEDEGTVGDGETAVGTLRECGRVFVDRGQFVEGAFGVVAVDAALAASGFVAARDGGAEGWWAGAHFGGFDAV